MADSKNPVRSQMGGSAPSPMGVGGGMYGRNKGPFDAPQDMGGGGIPTKFFDGMSDSVAKTMPTPTQTANVQNGPVRPGTKQFPYGGSGTKIR